MDQPLKVLFLAAEAAPFVKVGGLADVAAALPKALRRLGVDARVLIPRYASIRSDQFALRRTQESIMVPAGPDEERVHLLETEAPGNVPVYLIWDEKYFSAREKVYGFNDDAQRFTFFSRAIISTIRALDWKPDVIHANDWHTGLVPAWLNVYGRKDPIFRNIATLFTIHNLVYQGICGRLILTFGRMEDISHLPVEPPGQVNCMAQGIARADLVNTVSPTYGREILTPEYGSRLEGLLSERPDRLFGILNGIDNDIWNPALDPALTHNFDVSTVRMRTANKATLQRDLGLAVRAETPLLGVVTRLEELKGPAILAPALDRLLAHEDLQVVLLGTGDPQYEDQLRQLQQRYSGSMRAFIKFDDRMARRIYGSSDIYVVPSHIEPCGMGQMIAMRYGAVPVARATGGLSDTVLDCEAQPNRGNGFIFHDYTSEALERALLRAMAVYRDNHGLWETLQRRAMEMDFSWDGSARAYLDLYRRAQAVHGSKK